MNRIVTVIENRPGIRNELSYEHGLSLWIERAGRAVLFDTGASGSIVRNAALLGLDLSLVEAVVLSHGHSDHSGGLRPFVDAAGFRGRVVTGPSFFDPKYAYEKGGHHYLGPDFGADWLRSRGIEHEVVGTGVSGVATEVVPGVHVLNGFTRTHPQEADNPRFVVSRGPVSGPASFIVDDYRDEVCLVVETDLGPIVALGCAHPGVMNMLDQTRALFGPKLRAVLGGTHLMDSDERRSKVTLDYLFALGCERLGIAHCSGESAVGAVAADGASGYVMRTGSTLFW